MLRGAGICRRTNRSVLAVTRHLALKSSLDEPQGLHCPGLCCWARFHLPRQTVSSVRAGLPPLWFSALSPVPCSVPNMQFVFTKCLGRGQQPCRALPGCPLGGGRVLILHILSSSLSLFFTTQGHGLWLQPRQLWGEEKVARKQGCPPPLEQDLPLIIPLLPA